MTAPTGTARAYLDAVATALADLPVEERAELLEDLDAHLAAVAAEEGDVPLAVRLGPPERYAAELRASAGLPPAQAARRRGLGSGLGALVDRAVQTRSGREVSAFLPLLAPGWWVLRAYLAVFALAVLSGASARSALVLDVGLPLVGLVLLAGAVVLSVRLGRRQLPTPQRRALHTGELLLAAWSGLFVLTGAAGAAEVVYVQDGAPLTADAQWPLLSESGPVTDVLPYAADGTPLEGVLLFDQDGRPLRVGEQQWWPDGCQRTPRPPLAADGVPVPFSYPQRYVLVGPDAAGTSVCERELPRPEVPLPVMPTPSGVPSPSAVPSAVPTAAAPEAPAQGPAATPSPAAPAPAG